MQGCRWPSRTAAPRLLRAPAVCLALWRCRSWDEAPLTPLPPHRHESPLLTAAAAPPPARLSRSTPAAPSASATSRPKHAAASSAARPWSRCRSRPASKSCRAAPPRRWRVGDMGRGHGPGWLLVAGVQLALALARPPGVFPCLPCFLPQMGTKSSPRRRRPLMWRWMPSSLRPPAGRRRRSCVRRCEVARMSTQPSPVLQYHCCRRNLRPPYCYSRCLPRAFVLYSPAHTTLLPTNCALCTTKTAATMCTQEHTLAAEA